MAASNGSVALAFALLLTSGCVAQSFDSKEIEATAAALTGAGNVAVAFSEPLDGSYVGGGFVGADVNVIATASADLGVDHVDFVLDGTVLLASDASEPFSTVFLSKGFYGTHTITATAYDTSGGTATATLHLQVDTTAPTAVVSGAPSGSAVTGVVQLTVSGADTESGLDGLELFDVYGDTSQDPLGDKYVLLASGSGPVLSVPFDTSTVPAGKHTFGAEGRDKAGNLGGGYFFDLTVYHAALEPISLLTPAEGRFVKGVVRIFADGGGSGGADVYIDDTLIGSTQDAPYLLDWDTATATEGPHTVTVRLRGGTNPAKTLPPVHVVVDRTPPHLGPVTLTPSAQNVVSGVVTFSVNPSDDRGIRRVTFGPNNIAAATVTTPPYSMTWDTTSQSEGLHWFNVVVEDFAGNYDYQGVVVVAKNDTLTPPKVTFTTPVEGAGIGGTTQPYGESRFTVAPDVLYVDLAIDSYSFGRYYAPFPDYTNWGNSLFAPGTHALSATATDVLGHTTVAVVHFNLDQTPPTVALTQPLNGATVNGVVPLLATANDQYGLDHVEFYDNGTLIATAPAAPYAQSWDTTQVALGAHQLLARAFDVAGNYADSVAAVTVKAVPPPRDATPPTVAITAPSNGRAVTGTVSWTATATDNVGVTRVEFYDGTKLVKTLTKAPFGFGWNTTGLAGGAHKLTARAYDAAGNSATSAAVNVTVDSTPPTIKITSPTNGSTISNTVTVSATASDNVGLARVVFYLDGAPLVAMAGSKFAFPWDTSKVPSGSHKLKAIATDTAGNSTTSATVCITIKDVAPPTASIVSPTNGTRVLTKSTVKIAAKASDLNGVKKVEFYVAGALKCTDTCAPFTCAWSVPTGSGKSYSLQVKAYDAAGNVGPSSAITVKSQ